jgi:hypothetical protein
MYQSHENSVIGFQVYDAAGKRYSGANGTKPTRGGVLIKNQSVLGNVRLGDAL